MNHKLLVAAGASAVLILSSVGIIGAESVSDYCAQAYQACVQAKSLGAYANSLGVNTDLSSTDCTALYNSCVGGSTDNTPADDSYTPDSYTPPTNPVSTTDTTSKPPEQTAEEKKTIAQLLAEQAWLTALGLNDEEISMLNNISDLGKNWIKPFYQPERQERLVGLTAKSLNTHDQLTKDTEAWLKAKANNAPRETVAEFETAMADGHAEYKQALANVLKINPSDPTANFELGNEYFRQGTVNDFITARQLHERALMNLDQQERINVETKVKEDIERNGFAKAFNNPQPAESSFLTAMQSDIDSQFASVKDSSVAWLKQTSAYAKAEAYSAEVRGTFRALSTNIFHVDNAIIDQAVYGQ